MTLQNEKILVIGNKPYSCFPIAKIIDTFSYNVRCNFIVPGNNNGILYDQLALCNHLYENFVIHPASLEKIINIYNNEYDLSYINKNYIPFVNNMRKYNKVFHAKFGSSQNHILQKLNSPFKFSKIPRTGLNVVLSLINQGKKVVVTNFSITEEVRHSYCLKKEVAENYSKDESATCHSTRDEIKILRWLHENKFIDASLCLLGDQETPLLDLSGLSASDYIIDLIKKTYGICEIKK